VTDEHGEARYTIVGSMEARVAMGRISNESPLGRALMGRRAGDEAQVQTPRGESRVKLLAVS
jgi:transcription elongation factor GreA